MKNCTHCGDLKNSKSFHKHIKTSDGLQSWCKECNRKKEHRRLRRIDGDLRSAYALQDFAEFTANLSAVLPERAVSLRQLKSKYESKFGSKFNHYYFDLVLPDLIESGKLEIDRSCILIPKYRRGAGVQKAKRVETAKF